MLSEAIKRSSCFVIILTHCCAQRFNTLALTCQLDCFTQQKKIKYILVDTASPRPGYQPPLSQASLPCRSSKIVKQRSVNKTARVGARARHAGCKKLGMAALLLLFRLFMNKKKRRRRGLFRKRRYRCFSRAISLVVQFDGVIENLVSAVINEALRR